jgi:MFS family permease
LANQFGDFRCEGSSYVTLLNSSIILGSVIGIFSAIFFTEWLGRRGTMIVSLIISIIGLCITFFWSQTAVVIGVFLYGAGLDISYSSVFTFVTEFFAEEHRGRFYNIISLSFGIGTLVNPLAFYFIYDWKLVAIFVFILPIVISIFGFFLVVENTPIELISYHTPEDSYEAFMRIAKWNRVEDHGLTLEAIR